MDVRKVLRVLSTDYRIGLERRDDADYPPPLAGPVVAASASSSAATGAPAAAPLDQAQRDMRIYSQYFRRMELLIEYKNLRNPNHCPTGMYVMPDPDNLNEWHCVLFIHRGYYKEGVFKFVLQVPDGYPDEGPTVRFVTDMFHPLVDRDGGFSLRQ
ncbi:hypothetical protein HK405_000891, partial [Cladochytrium tenue]